MSSNNPAQRLVWDLPTRAFHWLLALSLAASYVTSLIGFDARQYHMWLGYWMIGLLTFRCVWGLVGTRHARFINFFPTPRRLFNYIKNTVRGESPETVGHNPLGSLMIFATLAILGAQAVSGLFMDDEIMFSGPYFNSASPELASTMNFLHNNLINVILGLVAVHIAAVLYHSFVRRERIIRAMLSGKKSADVVPEGESISGSRLGLAVAIAIATAAFTYWLVTRT
ncbi:MAG: cytochrome b/b6 domain-containing protein [Gammaproteobacteria bacterium]